MFGRSLTGTANRYQLFNLFAAAVVLFGAWLSVQAYFLKGLILAQNERWRRGLGMQVEREFAIGSFGRRERRKAANGVVRRRYVPSDRE